MSRLYRFISLAALAFALSAQAQEPELIEAGRRAYLVHCSNCHGDQARGDGPMREILSRPPSDLRAISRRNDGVFPFERIYRVLDGQEDIGGHGIREMPVWSLSFVERGSDAPQAAEVRRRILQLIYYLRSIQLQAEEPKSSGD